MRKKLYVFLAGMLGFGLALSCNLQMPESVTVKGHPGLYLNLGSPFAGNSTMPSLDDYLDAEKLAENLGDTAKVWNYTSASISVENNPTHDIDGEHDVRTYLVQFPIAEQTLDFTQYVKDMQDADADPISVTVPAGAHLIPVGNLASYIKPIPVLFFDGVDEWVSNIAVNDISNAMNSKITMEIGDSALATALSTVIKLKVEAIGIESAGGTDFIFGSVSGNDLVFTATKDVSPFAPGITPIDICFEFATMLPAGLPSSIPLVLDFQWKEATVNPGGLGLLGTFSGTSAGINVHSLTQDFLGGAKFKNVPAYLFVNGLPPSGNPGEQWKITLSDGTTEYTASGGDPITNVAYTTAIPSLPPDPTVDDNYAGTIGVPSIGSPIDLADAFNLPGDLAIIYEIIAPPNGVTVQNSSANPVITADMFVVLPLQFTYSGDPTKTITDSSSLIDYAKLEVAAFNELGTDDLFGREPGSNDDPFNQIEYVKVFYEITNNALDGLYLGIGTTGVTDPNDALDWIPLISGTSTDSATFDPIPNPFNPGFGLYVEQGADITIKPKSTDPGIKEFDISLAVEAKVELNIHQDL
jgi:hypothetical protein